MAQSIQEVADFDTKATPVAISASNPAMSLVRAADRDRVLRVRFAAPATAATAYVYLAFDADKLNPPDVPANGVVGGTFLLTLGDDVLIPLPAGLELWVGSSVAGCIVTWQVMAPTAAQGLA